MGLKSTEGPAYCVLYDDEFLRMLPLARLVHDVVEANDLATTLHHDTGGARIFVVNILGEYEP